MKQIKSRLFATFLSILLPGIGQVYKKQNFKTIFGYSIFFLFLILFILFKLQLHFWGITSLIIFIFCPSTVNHNLRWAYLYSATENWEIDPYY